MSEVYVNGCFVGVVDDGREFTERLISERRKTSLDRNINVVYNSNLDEVRVEATKGRVRRPLIVVKDGTPLLTEAHINQLKKNDISWDDLVQGGIIEYLDASEEESALVAFTTEDLTPHHTHLEIKPGAILGLTASLVPYGNFTSPVRLSIGAKGQKQALGFYTANFPLRMDMDVSLLHNPQIPIVQTMSNDISGFDKNPSGCNVVVAMLTHRGYNMDDAIVFNKGSVERGLARSFYFRPAIAEELRYSGGLVDEVSVPDKEVQGYKSEHDYRMLEGDGIIFPEARVKENEVIIGKTSPPRFLSSADEYSLASNIRRESSIALPYGENGTVDFVLITENGEGNKLVQVRIRGQRIPEIGDKFTSRHGQKGVIGMLVPSSDMPFSSSGIIPDLLFNPHGIPSRMTMSHLLELLGGKVGALSGRFIDGTAFEAETEERLRSELHELGFRENGTETFYNGQTGEQFKAKVFVGNMYYLKLKHMVANKMHSRARGPVQLLTRQPTEGRAKEGGLRLGEMEKDTFVAHGASLLLKERFDSDKTTVPVCEECGVIAIYDEYKNRKYCPTCGDNVEISFIEISYAFKLMLDEFKSLGVYPKLVLESKY